MAVACFSPTALKFKFKELSFEELSLAQPVLCLCMLIGFDAAPPVCISLAKSCPCVCVFPKILVWCQFEVQAVMFFRGLVVTWGGWCRKRGVCVASSEVVPFRSHAAFFIIFSLLSVGICYISLLEVQL